MKRALFAVALVALAGACGYDTGLHVAERHGSVGLEFFGNETYERDVERALQDEISRSIRDLTDVRIENPSKAEVVIRGTVRTYQRRDGVRSPDNKLLETGLYIEADATLFDRRSGRALGAGARAGSWVGFVLDDPDNESTARERALRHIADQLVLDLFKSVD